ncbi:hypothetical protein E1212_04710 [Jiangella ureilytica]|uniref:Uncharacterized protein n=1 Tax=Jiangella ureilytica TaxID=2530374 RepID=A0A4R4RWK2_9ACTN|nr:hypothetical protein [Jiangella ureilytica]TDC53789.1 hypothetical protein E1212_04710 [Jiangella ureilytica]
MTNWRARARLLAFACVAGLAVSGCGGDSDAGGNDGTTDGGATGRASDDGEELSPLEEYMGENSGFAGGGRMSVAISAGDLSEEDRQRMRQVEELVATCMEEAGFEYVPVDPFGGETKDDPFADAFALPPDEFAREYGYGMTTLMDPGREDEEVADPNQEIRDGLSEGALEAYNQALWGDMVQVSGDGNAVAVKPMPGETGPPEIENQGCHGEARSEVYGDDGGRMMGPDMSEFDGLFEDLEALRRRIESDPRVIEVTEAWAGCMAEAGYSDVEAVDDPENTVMERMSELYGWDDLPAADDEADDQADEESDEESDQESDQESGGPGDDQDDGGPGVSFGGPGRPADIDEEALAELQEYEIAIATADYDCEQEHVTEARREVAWGFEEEFVEQHRTELERYRDAMAEGPAGNAGGLG